MLMVFWCSMYSRWQDGAARFEEFMARHAEESRDDIQAIKSLNVFYQVGFHAQVLGPLKLFEAPVFPTVRFRQRVNVHPFLETQNAMNPYQFKPGLEKLLILSSILFEYRVESPKLEI